MGAVESLPASRTEGLGDVLHECAPAQPRNRRYIFGSRRQDRQAATNSPNSSGSSLLPGGGGGGGQKESLKSATVCYLSSTGHGGIVLGGRDGGANVSQSSSMELSSSSLQPRSSRTRGRLRDSLKRRSLWQLSSTWAPLQSREQEKQEQKQENQGGCLLSSDGDTYGLVACGQHQLNVNGDEDTRVNRMAAKPPPLQRSLLSASMPDLSIYQLHNQEYEVSSGVGAEMATYADGSDSSSDEYKDYTIGDVDEMEAAQPAPVNLTEPDVKSEEREDAPVPRPKSRRKLGPRAIGKYLSNRLSAYGHSTLTSSCESQNKKNNVVENDGAVKAEAATNNDVDQIEPSLLVTQSGDGLVQLNTNFSHMEMKHSGRAEEDGARSSLEGLVSPSTTPWLLLMEEKAERRESQVPEPSGVTAEARKEINRVDKHTVLADSTTNSGSSHLFVLPDDVALLSSSSSSLTLSEIELDGSPHAARPQTRADVGYGGGAGCNDDVLDYDEYIYLSSTCGADKENSRVREGEGGCVESEPDALATSVALCNNHSPLDYPNKEDDDEDDGEETHRWWPRRVLPVRNMQYMPKLNKVFSDCGLQLLGKGDAARDTYTCAHCARGSSASNSNSHNSSGHGTEGAGTPRGHRRNFARDQPLDEAMMLVDDHTSAANDAQIQTQTPLPLLASSSEQLYCSDNRCRNYHTRTSLVMRWLATGYPAKPVYRKESGHIIQQNSNSPCKSDYWDLLSRFPMRPTSSLALSSLREMAMSCSDDNSSSSGDSGSKSQMQTRRLGRSCVGLPGNCAGSYTGAAGDSDTDESTSDTDETYSSCKMRAAGSLSLNSSNQQQQQQRSKQKQKRVLSEPMQYILYNSYLRYYGKPNEQPLS
ncbi:hypothetical protein GGI11_004343 [Coemansia sp. RSA 2049]|nr:hypothetical protein GGI11_004343 [Coemansia sp. RSA 2049]